MIVEADGTEFKGNFVKGKKSGQGVQTWKDGASYSGEWKKNNMHGEGKF